MMHNNENSIKVSVGKITCGNEQNIFIFFFWGSVTLFLQTRRIAIAFKNYLLVALN